MILGEVTNAKQSPCTVAKRFQSFASVLGFPLRYVALEEVKSPCGS